MLPPSRIQIALLLIFIPCGPHTIGCLPWTATVRRGLLIGIPTLMHTFKGKPLTGDSPHISWTQIPCAPAIICEDEALRTLLLPPTPPHPPPKSITQSVQISSSINALWAARDRLLALTALFVRGLAGDRKPIACAYVQRQEPHA